MSALNRKLILITILSVSCVYWPQNPFAQSLVLTDTDEASNIELVATILPEYWLGGLPRDIDIEIRNKHPQYSYKLYVGELWDMSAAVRVMDNNGNRITNSPKVYYSTNPATFTEIELRNEETYKYKIDFAGLFLSDLDLSKIETITISIGFLFAYQRIDENSGELQFLDFRIRSGPLFIEK